MFTMVGPVRNGSVWFTTFHNVMPCVMMTPLG
ncbi:unannotated protein [freshwater metagenome]|uniref:Unannotated protein n=1 Tax=freshwater metagenome TaxID=449393 RepID=A0A6J6XN08_9ZZZZ